MEKLGSLEALSAEHDVRGFECGEVALDSWLVKFALINQQSGQTKTFVLPTLPAFGRKVVAFYSLVVGAVAREEALATLGKGTPKNQPVPVVLLARLAISTEYQGKGLGKALLKDALRRCLEVSRRAGCRAVLVHAKHETAAEFYRRAAGFEASPTNAFHLMLPMGHIAGFLGEAG
jgi:GNAT superfamily N-acetyltransferase